MSIRAFLGLDKHPDPKVAAQTDTVRKIVEALDQLEPGRARWIAAFAYILSRVARADLKITAEETRAMEQIVVERGGLSEDQAAIVVQMAKHQNLLFGGTENFLVTREFNKLADGEQKLALLDCLYAVAGAGDDISVVEDNEIGQVADELQVSRRDLIAIRSRHRDRLAVLKKPPESG